MLAGTQLLGYLSLYVTADITLTLKQCQHYNKLIKMHAQLSLSINPANNSNRDGCVSIWDLTLRMWELITSLFYVQNSKTRSKYTLCSIGKSNLGPH